jgi:CubicO group peptidase (beta-lactamase class C family)
LDKHISRDELKDLAAGTLKLWHVPGMAVAVVDREGVLLCEGYGDRNLASHLPVTPETLFPIASCTKAFTAMSLALLVDEEKLEWEQPVRKYLPAFKMWDPFATERLTIRDLLTHRSGLPGHDLIWYASDFSRRRSRVTVSGPNHTTRFQYQNLIW